MIVKSRCCLISLSFRITTLNLLSFRTPSLKFLSFRTPLGVRNLLLLFVLLNFRPANAQTAPTSRILPPPPTFHFPEAQKLVYSVEWHMLNAGTATILVTRSKDGEHLRSTADTSGMTNKIYPVHDTFDADVNPRTFCTQEISKHNQEGARRLDRKIHFDYPSLTSQVDDYDLKAGKQKHSEFDIPSCVSDVVSGFFYASSLDLRPGLIEIFPVNDGGKTTDVRIDVEGNNRIKVPAGGFQTIRVKAEPIAGPMKGKGVLWVWFSDDARRIPVHMKSKLGFATLLFQLQRIEPQQE
ncbi:MAG TPA: DUF3108 domain-containing protein [Terriglobales bacterium]|nr:DUF3108 domain-containing protein [Terriglobales bacterium]